MESLSSRPLHSAGGKGNRLATTEILSDGGRGWKGPSETTGTSMGVGVAAPQAGSL